MKSKPNTHEEKSPWSETHNVNINLSDRKSKYGICHTSSSLCPVFLQSGKRWERRWYGGTEEGEIVGNWGHGPERAKESGTFKKYVVRVVLARRAFGAFKHLGCQ